MGTSITILNPTMNSVASNKRTIKRQKFAYYVLLMFTMYDFIDDIQ